MACKFLFVGGAGLTLTCTGKMATMPADIAKSNIKSWAG